MLVSIGNNLLPKLQPKNKPYDVRDNKLTGFLVRVNISGKMVYMCEYARGKRVTIGKVGVITPMQARDLAKEILADVIKGEEPTRKKVSNVDQLTLSRFIENEYETWIKAHTKQGADEVKRIKRHFFSDYGNKLIADITALELERWRSKRIQEGIKPTTLNRDIACLRGAFSKAVEWGIIAANPLVKLKRLKTDSAAKVRYLDNDEEKRLRLALRTRDAEIRVARGNANKWREERRYSLKEDFSNSMFVDYLEPMVLISINTGLRRGELFNLTWDNINFETKILTVVGTTAKSSKTRHIPMNQEVLFVLNKWLSQNNKAGLVFKNSVGKIFNNVKKSWATLLSSAKIKNFRWHDMRHHFASKLVMAGVDLNIVRELLGHSDIKMTLRYAHLAPEHKANAVAKLVSEGWVM